MQYFKKFLVPASGLAVLTILASGAWHLADRSSNNEVNITDGDGQGIGGTGGIASDGDGQGIGGTG